MTGGVRSGSVGASDAVYFDADGNGCIALAIVVVVVCCRCCCLSWWRVCVFIKLHITAQPGAVMVICQYFNYGFILRGINSYVLVLIKLHITAQSGTAILILMFEVSVRLAADQWLQTQRRLQVRCHTTLKEPPSFTHYPSLLTVIRWTLQPSVALQRPRRMKPGRPYRLPRRVHGDEPT